MANYSTIVEWKWHSSGYAVSVAGAVCKMPNLYKFGNFPCIKHRMGDSVVQK